MEFVAAGWCAGKQLRLNRTTREIGMFDNWYVAFHFLTKSNSAAHDDVKGLFYIKSKKWICEN